MASRDRKYTSLANYIRGLLGPSPLYGLFLDLFYEASKALGVPQVRYEVDFSASDQFKGALQPLFDMAKDAVDTFKPYRSNFYVRRDALQPVFGLANILKGILYLLTVPLLVLIIAPIYALVNINRTTGKEVGEFLLMAASWLIDGALSIVRGATQLAFTPLGWAKMGIRALISKFTGKEDLWIENRPGIQDLVNKNEDDSHINKQELAKAVHSKYEKGIKRGEETGLTGQDQATARSFVSASSTSSADSESYLKLFARPTESDDLTTNENEKTKNSDNEFSKKSNNT